MQCSFTIHGGKAEKSAIYINFFEEINLMARVDKVGLAQDVEHLLCSDGQCYRYDPETVLLLKEAYMNTGTASDLKPKEVLAAYLRQ
jgi:hypothetical protein